MAVRRREDAEELRRLARATYFSVLAQRAPSTSAHVESVFNGLADELFKLAAHGGRMPP